MYPLLDRRPCHEDCFPKPSDRQLPSDSWKEGNLSIGAWQKSSGSSIGGSLLSCRVCLDLPSSCHGEPSFDQPEARVSERSDPLRSAECHLAAVRAGKERQATCKWPCRVWEFPTSRLALKGNQKDHEIISGVP